MPTSVRSASKRLPPRPRMHPQLAQGNHDPRVVEEVADIVLRTPSLSAVGRVNQHAFSA
jgi:hypothetical protein